MDVLTLQLFPPISKDRESMCGTFHSFDSLHSSPLFSMYSLCGKISLMVARVGVLRDAMLSKFNPPGFTAVALLEILSNSNLVPHMSDASI